MGMTMRRDVLGGVQIWRDADSGSGGGSTESGNDPVETVDFAAWQAEWSAGQKKAFGDYESGLKSALQKEREAKGELEKQLRALSKKAEGQTELQDQLRTLADALKEAKEEAQFFGEAGNAAIGCTQPKLALLAARADGLMGADGKVDWDGLKKSYPALFRDGSRIPAANAGDGHQQPPSTVTMDDLLRTARR